MDEIEQKDADLSNDENLLVEEAGDESDKVETPKKEYTTEQKLARVERLRSKYIKELGIEPESKSKVEPAKSPTKENPRELDETQLDYFDLKGYSESDEVEIFHTVMLKTGMSMREVLKDDYALAKVKSLRDEKAVQKATPSSTKRTGAGATDNIDILYEKFERTGELPTDFEARKAVIDRKAAKGDTSIPPWRR